MPDQLKSYLESIIDNIPADCLLFSEDFDPSFVLANKLPSAIFQQWDSNAPVLQAINKNILPDVEEFVKNSTGLFLLKKSQLIKTVENYQLIFLVKIYPGWLALILVRDLDFFSIADTHLNKILSHSKDILLKYDITEKKIVFISSGIEGILGKSYKEFINTPLNTLFNIVHPADKLRVDHFLQTINQGDFTEEFSALSFRLTEAGRNTYLTLNAIVEPSIQDPKELFCIIYNTTEEEKIKADLKATNDKLAQTEQELLASNKQLSLLNQKLEIHNAELEETYDRLVSSEEIFRQLAENTNDIFWLRDEKEIIYINNQFERIWGRSKQELIDNPYKITKWVHPDDSTKLEPWVNLTTLIPDEPYVEQYRIVKPDGEIRWLWSRIFPVMDKDGRPYRLVGIASDITEQKDFEDALLIAKEKAQESDMLKSTFLANISHEIRTPMNGIIGFAELISRDDIDANSRKNYVSIMKKSSEQLVRIIDDIIDFAKLEANQIHIAQEQVNLNAMLDQIHLFFENQMGTAANNSVALLIKKALPDTESVVLSDEHRIRQVFTHLIDNACKYTSDGFIEFGYELSDSKVKFFVKDTGLGIPLDKHEVVFERFRQVDEGHTRKYGGTGLGLPISKGLVNLLGGSIWFESEPHKGTTFYFTIPYRTDEKKREDRNEGKGDKEKYDWSDKIILVAEDDELNFEYMKIVLEPTKAKVIRAKDGSQAVKICSNLNFDIILMDIRLPVLNGIQATRQLREMGIQTPIVAQTAFAMDDDEQNCLAAGCDHYLSKPISKEKLFNVIDSLIYRNK